VAGFLRWPKIQTELTLLTADTSFNASLSLLSSTLYLMKIFETQSVGDSQSRERAIGLILRLAQSAERANVDITDYINEFSMLENATSTRPSHWFWCFPSPLPSFEPTHMSKQRRELLLRVWYGLLNNTAKMLAVRPPSFVNAECPDILISATSIDRPHSLQSAGDQQDMLKIVKILLHSGSDPNPRVTGPGNMVWEKLLVEVIESKASQ